MMYRNGEGVPQSLAEAVRWLEASAAQNHPPGQNNLGALYAAGEGVPENNGEAARLFRLAAAHGYPPAFQNLGRMYESGSGVEMDLSRAFMWFSLAFQSLRDASEDVNRVAARLTDEQIVEAQELVRLCTAPQFQDC